MIPATRAHLFVSAGTHEGMKGKNNEDRYAVSAFQVSSEDPTPSLFAMVSDGIGGHRAGEVAAGIAVEKITQAVASSDASQPLNVLQTAVIQASEEIHEQAEANSEQKGMGATCVCAWIIGDRLYTVTVGDSRLYLLRGDIIQKLSTDHTWIQEAIDQGALTPEQARNHPNAHVIRRYLGSQQTVVPDLRLRLSPSESDMRAESNQGFRLQPNDALVLCSDGLTDLVDENEILSIVKANGHEKAVNELINLANERGGHDNITVIILAVPEKGWIKPGVARNIPAAAVYEAGPTAPVTIGATVPVNGSGGEPAVPQEAAGMAPAVVEYAPARRRVSVGPMLAVIVVLFLFGMIAIGAAAIYLWQPNFSFFVTRTQTATTTHFPTAGPLISPTPTFTITPNLLSTSPSTFPARPTYTPWPTSTGFPFNPSTIFPPTSTNTSRP